jgi:hypothetical protein
MSTSRCSQTRVARSILAVGAALAVSACGGATKPPITGSSEPTEPTEAKVPDATAAAHGSTGLPGLDWGASADDVRAVYPGVTPADGGLWNAGAVEYKQAVTKFDIGANGLERINTEWTDGFISMEDCATGWKPLRATLDARFGASQADNLAAYWKTPTASITLAC